jgi:hypothetical protein
MKRIKLTQGKFALVSDIDYTYLNQWKWCADKGRNTYYAHRTLPKIRMHRVILERMGFKNFDFSDHKDGNGLNNQRRNLRPATPGQNKCNQIKYKNNTSGYKGVHWDRRNKKWRVQIRICGKLIHKGLYSDLIKASNAYDAAARQLHGKFAKLNKL